MERDQARVDTAIGGARRVSDAAAGEAACGPPRRANHGLMAGSATHTATHTEYVVLKRSTGGRRSLMTTSEAENSTLERSRCALEGLLFFFDNVMIQTYSTTHRDQIWLPLADAGYMG